MLDGRLHAIAGFYVTLTDIPFGCIAMTAIIRLSEGRDSIEAIASRYFLVNLITA